MTQLSTLLANLPYWEKDTENVFNYPEKPHILTKTDGDDWLYLNGWKIPISDLFEKLGRKA